MMGEPVRVWFFSPEPALALVIERALGSGFEVQVSDNTEFEGLLEQRTRWDVIVLDLRTFAADDFGAAVVRRLVEEVKSLEPSPPIIAMLADDDHQLPVRFIESGAYDTIANPLDIGELRLLLRRAYRSHRAEKELLELRAQEKSATQLDGLIGSTESMQQVIALAQKVGPCDVTALITGETGTGKSLMARAIHRLSTRAANPFVEFSCANLPETLVDDELFGHEKGAFTGAIANRRGRLEAADQGTLFLDEIGDLPLGLQAKLLRALQERSFERLGSSTSLKVNIRLICATHRNLEEMVARGHFREDLYYRLNVVQLHIPPLRERRDGIPVLAQHFLLRFAQQFGKKVHCFSNLALQALEEYTWPGNVRELENVVQRAVVLTEGTTIEVWHLPKLLHKGFEENGSVHSYDEEVREFKRRLVLRTLRECGGSKAKAARTLGIARGYLHRLINQLQIEAVEGVPATELSTDSGLYSKIM